MPVKSKTMTHNNNPSEPPGKTIPPSKHLREQIRAAAAWHVRGHSLTPPLAIAALTTHAEQVLTEIGLGLEYSNFTGVTINNELWRKQVAATPYNKRLLLLPKCLRRENKCRAGLDEFGLICAKCGSCKIAPFQAEAESLGYSVLVAEGSPVIMSLIATGQLEAVVGVSCLSVLENVFPYMEAGAVPGIAIPLLWDGCSETDFDADWAWDAIYQNTDAGTFRINVPELKGEIEGCFASAALRDLLPGNEPTAQLAVQWLSRAGKRWRPLLVACACQALTRQTGTLSMDIRKTALAIECFHKASLIHDDIEDGDHTRYGERTMHARHGIPVALNVGDFLIGEGYRLLSELEAPDYVKTRMLRIAAHGQRTLCLGQGQELAWSVSRGRVQVADVIDVFRKKTSPAFAVALKLGTVLAGSDSGDMETVLTEYSQALGIAYQIRDDIDDMHKPDETAGLSVLFALAYEKADDQQKQLLDTVFLTEKPSLQNSRAVADLFISLNLKDALYNMMENYKRQAVNCLSGLHDRNLKMLLRRLMSKIFNDL